MKIWDAFADIKTFDTNVPTVYDADSSTLLTELIESEGILEYNINRNNKNQDPSRLDTACYMGIELRPKRIGSCPNCLNSREQILLLKQKWKLAQSVDPLPSGSARQLQMLASAVVASSHESHRFSSHVCDLLFAVGREMPTETAAWWQRICRQQTTNPGVQRLVESIKTRVLMRSLDDVKWADATLDLFQVKEGQLPDIYPYHKTYLFENIHWLWNRFRPAHAISPFTDILESAIRIAMYDHSDSHAFVLWAYDRLCESGRDRPSIFRALLSFVMGSCLKTWQQRDADFIGALLDRQASDEERYELWLALTPEIMTNSWGYESSSSASSSSSSSSSASSSSSSKRFYSDINHGDALEWLPKVEWTRRLFVLVELRITSLEHHSQLVETAFSHACSDAILSKHMHRLYGIDYEQFLMRSVNQIKRPGNKWSKPADLSIVEHVDFTIASTELLEFMLTFRDPECSDSIWSSYLNLLRIACSKRVSPTVIAWFVAHAHVAFREHAKHTPNPKTMRISTYSPKPLSPAHLSDVREIIKSQTHLPQLIALCTEAWKCIPQTLSPVSLDLL